MKKLFFFLFVFDLHIHHKGKKNENEFCFLWLIMEQGKLYGMGRARGKKSHTRLYATYAVCAICATCALCNSSSGGSAINACICDVRERLGKEWSHLLHSAIQSVRLSRAQNEGGLFSLHVRVRISGQSTLYKGGNARDANK